MKIARLFLCGLLLAGVPGSGATNAGASQWSMLKLPDTGQTNNYATPVFGADSDYTINPPSFTNHGNGTSTDNVTGLLWQRVDGGEMTWTNALLYAATNTLGGWPAGSWRLPSVHELASILIYSRENPALNTNFFLSGGGTNADYWWSKDTLATDHARVWVSNAGGGVGPKVQNETLSAGGTLRYHARLVRGSSPPTNSPIHHFYNNGNGTITDLDTGLIWQQGEAAAMMNWTNAILYAESLTLGSFTDWRLPNIKELESLNDETLANPSIDTNFFLNAKSARYWASTTQNNRSTNAWWNEFIAGITSQSPKVGSNWVRAVRGPFTVTAPVLTVATNAAAGAGFRLSVHGDSGHLYTIQSSTNLANWANLFTTNPSATPFAWTDAGTNFPRRFYRVLLLP